jgi:hypothetical protein
MTRYVYNVRISHLKKQKKNSKIKITKLTENYKK